MVYFDALRLTKDLELKYPNVSLTGKDIQQQHNLYTYNPFMCVVVQTTNFTVLEEPSSKPTPVFFTPVSVLITNKMTGEHYNKLVPSMYHLYFNLTHKQDRAGAKNKMRFAMNITKDDTGEASDCIALKIEPSTDYATLLSFKSSGLNAVVRWRLLDSTAAMLTMTGEESEWLIDSSSILLPQFNERWEHSHGDHKYYVLVAARQNHAHDARRSNHLTVKCQKIRCVTWNYYSHAWKPGCMVISSTVFNLSCKCDEGNLFSGGQALCHPDDITPYRTEDFVAVIPHITYLHESWVYMAILVLGITWAHLLYWAYHTDYRKRLTWQAQVPALGYSAFSKVQYLVCLKTQYHTTSTPSLTLMGEVRCGPRIDFDWHKDNYFQNNTQLWVFCTSKYRLGNILAVVISVDNKGENPSWYVDGVYVRDLETGQEWICTDKTCVPDSFLPYKVLKTTALRAPTTTDLCLKMFKDFHYIGVLISSNSDFSSPQHRVKAVLSMVVSTVVVATLSLGVIKLPCKRLPIELEGEDIWVVDGWAVSYAAIVGAVSSPLCIGITILITASFKRGLKKIHWYPPLMKIEEPTSANDRPTPYHSGSPSRNPAVLLDHNENFPQAIDLTDNQNIDTLQQDQHGQPVQPDQQDQQDHLEHIQSQRELMHIARRISIASQTSEDPDEISLEYQSIPSEFGMEDLHRQRLTEPYPELHQLMNRNQRDRKYGKRKWYRRLIFPSNVAYCLIILFTLAMIYTISYITEKYTKKERSLYCIIATMALLQMIFIIEPLIIMLTGQIKQSNTSRISKKDVFPHVQADEFQSGLRAASTGVTSANRHVGEDREHLFYAKENSSTRVCEKIIKKSVKETFKSRIDTNYFTGFLSAVILIAIVNIKIGNVFNRYNQLKTVENLLNIGERHVSPFQAITVDELWSNIYAMYYNLHHDLTDVGRNNHYVVLSALVITQHRTSDNGCNYVDNVTSPCAGNFMNYKTDSRSYSRSWDIPFDGKPRPGPYTYIKPTISSSLPLLFTTVKTDQSEYPTGGYEVIIPVESNASNTFKFLLTSGWVDASTKLIIVTVDLYNPGTKLATSVRVYYEFTGVAIYQNSDVFSFYVSDRGPAIMCLFSIFVILVLYNIFIHIIMIREIGFCNHIAKFHNGLHVSEIMFCIVTIFVIKLSQNLITNLFEERREIRFYKKQEELFADFGGLGHVEFFAIIGYCCIYIFRILDIMRYARDIPLFGKFVGVAIHSMQIVIFPIYGFVLFNLVGKSIFGTQVHIYQGYFGAMMMTFNPHNYNAHIFTNFSVIGYIYFIIMGIVMHWFIINLFICVINDAITTMSHLNTSDNLTQIIWNQIKPMFATKRTQRAPVYAQSQSHKRQRKFLRKLFGPYGDT